MQPQEEGEPPSAQRHEARDADDLQDAQDLTAEEHHMLLLLRQPLRLQPKAEIVERGS
jgi:hypothetical protein